MTKILNRFDYKLICADKNLLIRELAEKNKANLRQADLWQADLRRADLRRADLREADLRGANLKGADLIEASLRGADLLEANLLEADLREADLSGANLWRAKLLEVNLRGAKIDDKKIISYKDISNIGNHKRQLRCFMLDDDSFYFMTGCFSGTEKELKIKVLEKYGKYCEYMKTIKFLKNLCINYKI